MGSYKVKLFYSYCHADELLRVSMEKALAILRKNNLLTDWHDRQIIPGQNITKRIKDEMSQSNIIAFLVSPDFLASPACTEEWMMAKEMAKNGQKILVPVIMRTCSWLDFDDMSTRLVIPTDGKPVLTWNDQDAAWQNVYTELKNVIINIRNTFQSKEEFKDQLTTLEFCSQYQEKISLEDLFIFPVVFAQQKNRDIEEVLNNESDIFRTNRILIRGDEQSGKSTLCSHLYFHLIDRGKPVLFVDLNNIGDKKPNEEIYRKLYSEQFCGDYDLWKSQDNKAIIFDNLSHKPNNLEHIDFVKEHFTIIVIATSSDTYFAYYRDELRLADFSVLTLAPLTHAKQEMLIKKWLEIRKKNTNTSEPIEHGKIDRLERNVNSIIINNKILPRFPFFILSILQTYEGFMPQDIQITAYGHCYYALILAHLIKSGIDKNDDDLNQCFNFMSHLAFEIHEEKYKPAIIDDNEYCDFVYRYKQKYIISDAILNRLSGPNGMLKLNNGARTFSVPYSYYFFLGRHLAKTYKLNRNYVSDMIEKSYLRDNTLSLIFAIHHAQDVEIIDDILVHTICAIDMVRPARLDKEETCIFHELMDSIPSEILSNNSIEEERTLERIDRDRHETDNSYEDSLESDHELVNQIYKSQKYIEILSQILKNRAGNLEIVKIDEIIQTICDAGLRLISVILFNEAEIQDLTHYIAKKYEESNINSPEKGRFEKVSELKKLVKYTIFVWTISNIEKVVSSISKPELKGIIKLINERNRTPAYDLIYYFFSLDTADIFDESQKNKLKNLLNKYNKKEMIFVHRLLSLRTQYYLNTHSIKEPLRQSVSSMLELSYKSPPFSPH